jgi:large subunit ribosomal protein L10
MDYRGLTVAQLTELRRELHKSGVEMAVIKNTLFRMAAAETNTAVDESLLHGPTAVVFAGEDPTEPVKILTAFVKKHPHIVIKGGAVENMALNADQVKALGKIPTRPVLLGQMAGVLQAPMGQLAGGMNALLSQFARLLQALAEKQETPAEA